MQTKIIEIRDRATCIPALCVEMIDLNHPIRNYWIHGRCGYAFDMDHPVILVTRLEGGGKAHNDCYDWGDRTMSVAHRYIQQHWRSLSDGDVVDVRFILGEEPAPAESEFVTHPR